jgi:hypothetical protein
MDERWRGMTGSGKNNSGGDSQSLRDDKSFVDDSFETYEDYKRFLKEMHKDMFEKNENIKAEQAQSQKKASDYEQAFNTYRENLNTMSEANRMAMEIMKSIAHIQSQYIKQVFDDFGQMIRENAEAQQTAEKGNTSTDPAQHFKKAMNRAFDHSAQIADILINSNHELFQTAKKTINDNVSLFNNIMFKRKH